MDESMEGNGEGETSRREEEKAEAAAEAAVQTLKKGPWTAEEDEILVDFVTKNGPRDWNSIPSKTLLPRSGKSCRLRWVNKHRPGLKPRGKLTEEEKQLIVMMQKEIGNKWATIASLMPGRTDNDVKNYWSTRQRKQERLLKQQQEKEELGHGKE